MNITYIIGNGFDIGLGLRTRYSDFIPHLKGELESLLDASRSGVSEMESKVASWILEAIKTHKQNFWSDAEIAFGELPFSEIANKANISISDAVKLTHDRFIGSMQRWLNDEVARANYSELSDGIAQRMFMSNLFIGWIKEAPKSTSDYFQKLAREGGKVDFVSFNYTKTLEHLLPGSGEDTFEVQYLNNKYNVRWGEVCHVHGTCAPQGQARQLVFGVDNNAQIVDENANKDGEVRARLLKTEYQGYIGTGELGRAYQLIENADVVALFGLSFGATDRYWWSLLARFISYPNKQLVIYPYITDEHEIEESYDTIRYKYNMVTKVFASLEASVIDNVRRGEIAAKISVPQPMLPLYGRGAQGRCDFLNLSEMGKQLELYPRFGVSVRQG